MVVSVSVTDPCDHWADWEPRLTATVQHHKRVLYHILLAWEKIKIQNSKCSLYACVSLSHHCHAEKLKAGGCLYRFEIWESV